MRAAGVLLAFATFGGCGRVAFDPLGGGDGGGTGAGDTGGSSGGADSSSPVTCMAGMLVCDSFENGFVTTGWNISTASGTIVADTTRAYRGTTSIHAHSNPIGSGTTNPGAVMTTQKGLPITGTIHTRVWIYVQSPHPPGEFDQLVNFSSSGGNGISLGTRNGHLAANDYTEPGYAESTTAQLPVNRWACLQLSIPSGTTTTTRVYLDGAEVTDAALPKASAQPQPTRIEVGVQWVGTVSSLPATDVWFDELLVDDQPLTCSQ